MAESLSTIKKTLKLAVGYRALIIFSVILIIVTATVDRGRGGLLKPLLDAVKQQEGIQGQLKTVILLLAIASIAAAILKYFKEVLSNYVTQKIIVDLRNKLAEKIISLDIGFFVRNRSGDLASRVSNDTLGAEQVITFFFENLIMNASHCIIAISLMFYASSYLGLITIALIPAYLFPVNRIARKLKKKKLQSLVHLGEVLDRFVKFCRGIKVIKSFNKENDELKLFGESNQGYFRRMMQAVKKRAMSLSIVEVFASIGLVLLFFVIGILMTNQELTVGSVAVLGYALVLFNTSSRALAKDYNRLQEGLPACQRILEILEQEPEYLAGEKTIESIDSIRFINTGFKYDNEWIVKDLNLKIEQGEIIALVGKSGVGKTTLIDLICKYYIPQEGKILINDVDIKEIKPASLRKCIGYCPQEAVIFNGTIRENILYGNENTGEGRIKMACELSGITDFAPDEKRLNREVGENGMALSGGQKQRVSICRALLGDISLLILDEPTSQLDVETEEKIRDAVTNFVKESNGKCSAIIISHRPTTIQYVDKVWIIDKNQPVKICKPEEYTFNVR